MTRGFDDRGHLLRGTVVRSKQGRDLGHPYIVIEDQGGDRVLVADGKVRGIAKAKKKNRKHLVVVGTALPQALFDEAMQKEPCERERDIALRKLLKPYERRAETAPIAEKEITDRERPDATVVEP